MPQKLQLPQKLRWLPLVMRYHGSVVPAILPLVIFHGLFGVGIGLLYRQGVPIAMPSLANVIPSIVLGLLLVFRTNTAYERHWEGRKLWGSLVNTTRNLSRQIWVVVADREPQDWSGKANALQLLVAFMVSTKLHLRQEAVNYELKALVQPWQYAALEQAGNPPLKIAFWLEDYLQQQYQNGKIDIYQLTYLDKLVDQLVDALGGCERILKTPMPLAYAIHLKQLLILYCLLLPFGLVEQLGLWTGVIVALISFTLFGVEAIGIEIENPFGKDINDLPLDAICATIQNNIEELLSSTPASAERSKLVDYGN
jgi:ion channel-forming bestrophin family protein